MSEYSQRVLPGLAALLTLLAVIVVVAQVDSAESERHAQEFRSLVVSRLSALRANLESVLNARIHLARGLAAFARASEELTPEGFRAFAEALHRVQPGIRSLQLAPDGVVRHVYPLSGNEAALGHDLLSDANRNRAARLSIETRRLVLAGPLPLRQGGRGVIGRVPVYVPEPGDGADGERFWGLAIVVLDFDFVLRAAGLPQAAEDLDIVLRGRDSMGAFGDVIDGDVAIFERQPARLEVSLPSGSWMLAAIPTGGWPTDWQGRQLLWLGGSGLALMAGLLVFLLLRRPEQMRRAVEAATADMRESRGRYRLLFDQTPNAIMVLDAESFKVLEFNEKAVQTLGFGREELAGMSALEWDAGEGWKRLPRFVSTLVKDAENELETRFLNARGEAIDVWLSMRPVSIDDRDAIHIVFVDVTWRKRNEAQLRKLSHAVEQSPAMVLITDPHGVIEYVNPKYAEVCGYSCDELVGAKPSIVSSGETPATVYRDLWQTLKQGREWHGELLNRRRNGTTFWVSTHISALIDDDGVITHFVAMQEDVTERKLAHETVTRQYEFQQTLIDALPSPVFYKDEQGAYLGCNIAFAEFLGLPREKIVGHTVYDLADPEQAKVFEQADLKLLRNPCKQMYETRVRVADGSDRDVVFYKAPFYRHDGSLGGLIGTLLDITDRKRTEVMLRRAAEGVSGEVGQAFFESLTHYIAGALSVDFAFVGELAGDNDEEIRTLAVYAHGQSASNFSYKLKDTPCANVINQGVCMHTRQVQLLFPDDHLLADMGVESYAGYPLRDSRGNTLGLLVVMDSQEIDGVDSVLSLLQIFATRAAAELQRRRAEEDLRMAATVFETTSEAIMVTDADNRIKAVNPAFSDITGYGEDEVLGRDPSLLRSGRHGAEFYTAMWRSLSENGNWEGEIWNRRKNGEVYPEWLSISAIGNEVGRRRDHVAVFTDITKRKQDEEKIWRQANFDALTGLPNRFLFMDRLSRALNQAEESGGRVAVLLIDLDRLKWINDMLGHSNGDRLLQHVSQRLLSCVESGDTVSRWAGDEFSVVVTDIDEPDGAVSVVDRVQTAISRSFAIESQEAFVTASIGLSIYPDDGTDPESLMSNAASAMVQAKGFGGNGYRRYSDELSRKALDRISLERDLHWAVERRELVVHYQPILSLDEQVVVGAEALVRWQHPKRGLIAPDVFIPVAEETGLIAEIGEWVLQAVCAHAVSWRDSGLPPIHLAVNVSRHQFMRQNFEARVLDLIEQSGVDPGVLILEVTESTMAEDETALIGVMDRFRSHGLRWSLDDFGTGYSSLSNLKNIPVDLLKIDKSFIADVNSNQDDAAVAKAIVVMAKTLGLKVVAEGVCNDSQHQFLRQLGCEYGQGFLFSPPLAWEPFRRFTRARLQQRRPRLVIDGEAG